MQEYENDIRHTYCSMVVWESVSSSDSSPVLYVNENGYCCTTPALCIYWPTLATALRQYKTRAN